MLRAAAADGGRAPRRHAHHLARGVELKAPVRDIGFDRGSVRFTADQQGTAYHFKGTLEENTVTGTIERAGKPPASFTLRFVE